MPRVEAGRQGRVPHHRQPGHPLGQRVQRVGQPPVFGGAERLA